MPNAMNLSLLDAIESAFQLLSAEPDPLAFDGTELGHGLPTRPIAVNEIRELLLSRSEPALRDTVWAEAIRLVRQGTDREQWMLAAVGLMVPGLRSVVGSGTALAREDAAAEAVTEFLSRVSRMDPAAERMFPRLLGAARRGALRARRKSAEARQTPITGSGDPVGVSSHRPSHPDLALDGLLRNGVISKEERDLIGRTRLEDESLIEAARRLGISYHACSRRRSRAERRIAQHFAALGFRSESDMRNRSVWRSPAPGASPVPNEPVAA
ncbi:hypothetical protein [Streptomyces sp. 769]|uniref:hypothetical protein n=1 Tax=Streptomyces sp. 769 TaxID=1262452 RepID=UPI000690F52F|nr:hypothetical protein [Streptomyces sp. 769]